MLQAVKPFNVHQNKQVNTNQNKQNNKVGFSGLYDGGGLQPHEIIDLKDQFQGAADTMKTVADFLAQSQAGGVNALQNRITTHEQLCGTQLGNFDQRMKQFEQKQAQGLLAVKGQVAGIEQKVVPQIQTLAQDYTQFARQQEAKTAYTEKRIAQLEQRTQQQDETIANLTRQLQESRDTIRAQQDLLNETLATLGKVNIVTIPQKSSLELPQG